jgi:truncated hemoglobin YjbI/ankyrin repeat protein
MAGVDGLDSLQHRRLFDTTHDFRPFRGTDVFERIGGQPAVDRLVDTFYDALAADRPLRQLFPRDLAEGRALQKLFFAEWLGGPAAYSEEAHASLRHRHDGHAITDDLADRWLTHFDNALRSTIATAVDRQAISAAAHTLAHLLVSRQLAPQTVSASKSRRAARPADAPREVAWCGIAARTLNQAVTSARRGDIDDLHLVLDQAPDLALPSYAAAIMQAAALAGRTFVVQALLGRGTGPDHPFYLPVRSVGAAYEQVLYVTPLCAARLKRRRDVEAILLDAGAIDDVFTAAFLGDLPALTHILGIEPALASAPDPAVDVLDITPIDHAAAGGQLAALQLLLEHVHQLPAGGVRALRGAAAHGHTDIVKMLLARDADASRIGAGRWVVHAELAPLLAGRGATVGGDGGWIGASCTGNQGRTDDPDYVRALLRHGAHVDDRRTGPNSGVTGDRAVDATALHYAAQAGFLKTIEVLLAHGADPLAQDNEGRTARDWVDQAAPTVSRGPVRDLLERAEGRRRALRL